MLRTGSRSMAENMGSKMGAFLKAPLAAWLLLLALLVSQSMGGECVHRRRVMDPQRINAADGYPGGATDPVPLPARLPYWGQSIGGTYYNWGYFGVRNQHPQYIDYRGYYGQYQEFGYMKGY